MSEVWYEEFGLDPEVIDLPAGWVKIAVDLLHALSAVEGWSSTKVLQVKEKFGGLRFYHEVRSDEVDRLVALAEERSWSVCQRCGVEDSSQVKTRNRMRTLCEKCFKGETK